MNRKRGQLEQFLHFSLGSYISLAAHMYIYACTSLPFVYFFILFSPHYYQILLCEAKEKSARCYCCAHVDSACLGRFFHLLSCVILLLKTEDSTVQVFRYGYGMSPSGYLLSGVVFTARARKKNTSLD